MSIYDYVEDSRTVPFTKDKNGRSFRVFPITLKDLGVILNVFSDFVEKLFDQNKDKGKITAFSLIDQYPDLVRAIIVRASREEDVEKANAAVDQFPIGVQTTALLKIWDLMALDMKDLGNVLAEFAEVLGKVSNNLEKKNPAQPSVSGKNISNKTLNG